MTSLHDPHALLGAPDGALVVVVGDHPRDGLGRSCAATAGELGVTLLVPRTATVDAHALIALVDAHGVRRFGVLAPAGAAAAAMTLANAAGTRCTGIALVAERNRPFAPLGSFGAAEPPERALRHAAALRPHFPDPTGP